MKNLFSIIRNKKGFSLTELVVALGIMGIASLGVMDLIENQNEMTSYSKTRGEEETLAKTTRLNLLKASQCNDNLAGVLVPSNIASIDDSKGRVAISVDDFFGTSSNKVTLSGLSITPLPGNAPAEGDNLVFFNIAMTRELDGKMPITTTKSFLLRVELDASNRIMRCNTSVATVAGNLAQNHCSSTNGIWNAGASTCTYTCPTMGSGLTNQILTVGCLDDREANILNDDYIKLAGDTVGGRLIMTGRTLNVGGQIRSNNQICVGGICRNFTAQDCTGTTIAGGVQTTGAMICRGPVDCGNTRYFRGFTSGGVAICEPVPMDSCTNTSYFIKEILANGQVVCDEIEPPTPIVPASAGNYVRNIPASGTPITYIPDRSLTALTCAAGQFIEGANGSTPRCVKPADVSIFGQICEPGFAMRSINSAGVAVCEQVQCNSVWGPSESTKCSGVTYTQEDGCGFYREAVGTKTNGICASCSVSSWTPATSGYCSGTSFTQTSNCDTTRTATGTKSCAPAQGTWTADMCGSSACVEDIWYSGSPHPPCPGTTACTLGTDTICKKNIGSGDFYVRFYTCQ